MNFKINRISKSRRKSSGQALVGVLVMGALATVTVAGVLKLTSTYSKNEKKFNLNSDWASLISSIQLFINDPTRCTPTLSSSVFDSATGLSLNQLDFYIAKNKTINSIYTKSIIIKRDLPKYLTVDNGDNTSLIPVYLEIKAKKVTGANNTEVQNQASDLFSGYTSSTDNNGINLIQFQILVDSSNKILGCQAASETPIFCSDLNGTSLPVPGAEHLGHQDPRCQFKNSIRFYANLFPGTHVGTGGIQFGDPFAPGSGNNTTPGTAVPDSITDDIKNSSMNFTAATLNLNSPKVNITPNATGSFQVSGAAVIDTSLTVKNRSVLTSSCSTQSCDSSTIVWTKTDTYPDGIYGCGCTSPNPVQYMVSGGAECNPGDQFIISGPSTDSSASQSIRVAACSSFNRPKQVYVTCCTPSAAMPAAILNPPDPPTVISVNPTHGPSGGGTLLTITGKGFHTGMTATIDGVSCDGATLLSSTSMSCNTPAHLAGGPYAVTVVNTSNLIKTTPPQSGSGTKDKAYTYDPTPSPTPSPSPIAAGEGWCVISSDTRTTCPSGTYYGGNQGRGPAHQVSPDPSTAFPVKFPPADYTGPHDPKLYDFGTNNLYCGDYHRPNGGTPPQGLGEHCIYRNQECAGIAWCFVPVPLPESGVPPMNLSDHPNTFPQSLGAYSPN